MSSSNPWKTSRVMGAATWALAWVLAGVVGCAGFSRGDRWVDDEDEDAPPESGAEDPTTGAASGTPPDTDDPSGDPSDDSSADPSGDPQTTGESDALSYEAEIHMLIVAGCDRCHSPQGSANGTRFVLVASNATASYETVLSFVDLGNPKGSRLLSKGAGMGHGGGAVYDTRSAAYDQILTWIEQGAHP